MQSLGFMSDRDQRLAYILNWKQIMDEANREARLREAVEQRQQEATMRRQAEEKFRQSEEKLVKAAQNLLEGGMAPEKVAETCGLPLEEVLNPVK
jgi:hypothetical protein